VLLALEEGRPRDALARCSELAEVASKMGEGSEAPFAAALEALARLALGDPAANAAVDRALQRLREVDSRWMLACIANRAAEIDLAGGRLQWAKQRAQDALGAAGSIARRSELVLARALLARIAVRTGDRPAALAQLELLRPDLVPPGALGGRAAAAVAQASGELGVPIPTPLPTVATTPAS
jgi:hypothetical protein